MKRPDVYQACQELDRRTKSRNDVSIITGTYKKINLAQTGSKDNNFVNFSHFLEKVVYPRAFNHVNIMPVILDLHWYNIICLGYRLEMGGEDANLLTERRVETDLETAVDQSFVKIKYKTFPTRVMGRNGRKKGFGDTVLVYGVKKMNDEVKKCEGLTGPVGIPAPPLNISLSSSSSCSSRSSSV